ncbi:uncharacterized protein [Nicotiana sylvestris]|uniref:uncharacterized protein n=1 Tax=Nicotiana sylvestris TaxID=4096 RepID=UPI00388C9003
MGDFNSVLNFEDRIGGNSITMDEIEDFHQCVENCELIELTTSGNNFSAQYLNEGISDHCPLKLTPLNARKRAKAAFKYCNVWASHPNFLEVVKELKDLNRRYFNNIIAIADEDRLALARAQASIHSNTLDTRLQEEEQKRFYNFMKSSYLAEVFLQQRSKATWIKLGDDNNIYFFSIINRGYKLTKKTQQQSLWDYYQELLGTRGRNRVQAFQSFLRNGQTLTTAKQLQLVWPYTTVEVKAAMFSIEETKSPGPDGYGSGFYKASWSIIGEEVTNAILEFFENGQLLTQISSTIIALIPKGGERTQARRPMSPLLFVLVMDYLTGVLRRMSYLPDFQHHPMCKSTKLTHLIFADDLMLFCKGNIKSIHRPVEVVTIFKLGQIHTMIVFASLVPLPQHKLVKSLVPLSRRLFQSVQ